MCCEFGLEVTPTGFAGLPRKSQYCCAILSSLFHLVVLLPAGVAPPVRFKKSCCFLAFCHSLDLPGLDLIFKPLTLDAEVMRGREVVGGI